MNIKSFLFIFLLLPSSVFSQKLSWSVSQKVDGRMVYTEILGKYNNYYYVVKYDKKSKQSFKIEKYRNNLSPSHSYEFKASKNQSIEKIILVEGNVQIYKSYFDKESKEIKLDVTVLNTGLVPVIKDRNIARTQMNKGSSRIFTMSLDEYNNQLLLTFPINKKENITYFQIQIYDKLINKKSENTLTISHEDEFTLSNIGLFDNVFTAVMRSNYNKKNRIQKYVYSFLKYNILENKLIIIDLFDKTYKSNIPKYSYNKLTGEFLVSSFFGEYEKAGISGIEYMKICKNCDSAYYNRILFSEHLENELLGKNTKKENLENYHLRKIVMRNDGGIIFIGEYFSVQREFYNDYYAINSNYVKYFYRYSDLVLFSISPEGKIDWTKVIRKEQVSMNDDGYYSSFLIGATKSKMLLVYNDLSRSNWHLVSNEIDPSGEIDSDILVGKNTFDGFLIPKNGKQVSENELLIPGFDRKKGFVLLKIELL